jgi:hypothetical protein
MARLAPRDKALLIYALAVYSAKAHGGPALKSTLISRMLDSEQLADIDDLVQRRIELEHRRGWHEPRQGARDEHRETG